MQGMTMKQFRRQRFFDLLELYRDAKKRLGTDAGKRDFIALSVQIHIAKGDVPKRFWPYINR